MATANRRPKRRRNSSHADVSNGDTKLPAGKTAEEKNDEESNDEDEFEKSSFEVYVLDGVEYKRYADFVAAKRRRNQNYLRNLGFDTKTDRTRRPATKPSPGSAIEVNSDTEGAEGETAPPSSSLSPHGRNKKRKGTIVSPVSTYYERYLNDEAACLDGGSGTFGISLDGASRNVDFFDEVSDLLLRLEREHQKRLQLSSAEPELPNDENPPGEEFDGSDSGADTTTRTTNANDGTTTAAAAAAAAAPEETNTEFGIATDESSVGQVGALDKRDTGIPAPKSATHLATDAKPSPINPGGEESGLAGAVNATGSLAANEKDKALRASNTREISSLLEKIRVRVAPVGSSEDPSTREGFLAAFYRLKGIPLVLRLLEDSREEDGRYNHGSANPNESNGELPIGDGIVTLCLSILRDLCCLSVLPSSPGTTSAAEKLALDLVHASGLELLYDLASSMGEIVDSKTTGEVLDSTKEGRKRGRKKILASRRSGRDRKTTKFADTRPPKPAARAKQQRRALETTRHAWSVCANLTYFGSVTNLMGKEDLLDLADLAYWTVAALDCHVTEELVKILPPSTNPSKKKRAPNKKRESKPRFTSPETVQQTLDVAAEVSRVLDPVLGTIRNLVADTVAAPLDWEAKGLVSRLLDVLCKGEDDSKPRKETSEADAKNWLHFVKEAFQVLIEPIPNTTVFRWMEQSEVTVWELLGVFKVCLGKGILSTCAYDVERLVGMWIRFLRRFGGSSSRITLRVLGLVDGLIFPSATMDGESSSFALVRKQILIREGFLDELIDLSNGFSPSEGDTVRTEIESMIARLR